MTLVLSRSKKINPILFLSLYVYLTTYQSCALDLREPPVELQIGGWCLLLVLLMSAHLNGLVLIPYDETWLGTIPMIPNFPLKSITNSLKSYRFSLKSP